MENLKNVITEILKIVYEKAGAALIFAVLAMSLKQYISVCGMKVFKKLFDDFRHDKHFRYQFFFFFYSFFILLQTILCRSIYATTFSNVLGSWSAFNDDGTVNVDVFENIIMFIPLIVLLFAAFPRTLSYKCKRKIDGLINIISRAFFYSFFVSVCIEFTQMFFKLGTFQLSDMAYNSLGGIIGGVIYYILAKLTKKKSVSEINNGDI